MEVQSEKHWRLDERLRTLKLFQRRSMCRLCCRDSGEGLRNSESDGHYSICGSMSKMCMTVAKVSAHHENRLEEETGLEQLHQVTASRFRNLPGAGV